MISDRAFLLTILEQPDELPPRLVYADWLDEHGETARAEFIRLQCAGDNERRQHGLLHQHGAEWAEPIFRHAYSYRFHRGFIEELTIQARIFLEVGEQLFLEAPIRRLRLIGAHGLIDRLVQMPELRRVRALHLTGCAIGDEGVKSLARASVLADVHTVRLGANAVTDEGVARLIEASNFPHLQALVLRDNLIGDQGAQLLASARGWPRLQCLDLSDNLIGEAAVHALAQSPRWRTLQRLDLSHQFKGHNRAPRPRERASSAILAANNNNGRMI